MFRKGPTPVWGTKCNICSDHSELVLSWERVQAQKVGSRRKATRELIKSQNWKLPHRDQREPDTQSPGITDEVCLRMNPVVF